MARRMTPEDILSTKWVSDPQLSLDGRWVAYVVRRVDPEKLDPSTADRYVTDIRLTRTDEAAGAGGDYRDPARKPMALVVG